MKAYVTSIGERTAEICCRQLQRFGFQVVLLDKTEPWIHKYTAFIKRAAFAGEDCLRIDADVIPNANVARLQQEIDLINSKIPWLYMIQFRGYDFYRNNVGIVSPVFYAKESLPIIAANLDKLDSRRPEASAWRLDEINFNTHTSDLILGMHGFFQDEAHFARHYKHKTDRKQMHEYDFDLARELFLLSSAQGAVDGTIPPTPGPGTN